MSTPPTVTPEDITLLSLVKQAGLSADSLRQLLQVHRSIQTVLKSHQITDVATLNQRLEQAAPTRQSVMQYLVQLPHRELADLEYVVHLAKVTQDQQQARAAQGRE